MRPIYSKVFVSCCFSQGLYQHTQCR